MRILIISQNYMPEMGALSNRLAPIVRQLAARGHEVLVATGMPNYPAGVVFDGYQGRRFVRETAEDCTILRTAYFTTARNRSKWLQLRSYLSFIPAVFHSGLRAGPVDVIMVTSPPIFPALAAIWLAFLRRAKLVFDIRDLWPDEIVACGAGKEGSLPVRIIRSIERAAYRAADCVSCTTHAFIETVVSRGVAREKTVFTPNGADLSLFRPLPPENEISAQYPFGDKFVVMYSGLLGIKHGLDTIVAAAERLRDRPEILFFIRGSGPKRAELVEAVQDAGLTNVIFGGERPLGDLPYILARADVCVTSLLPEPYLDKIISVKIFEYLACAKPVVAALSGEGARVVTQSGGGIVVPPGDPSALAAAILELYNDPARRTAMGVNGRNHVEEHYSRETTADGLEQTLRRLCAPVALAR